jgi:hypothetical protein
MLTAAINRSLTDHLRALSSPAASAIGPVAVTSTPLHSPDVLANLVRHLFQSPGPHRCVPKTPGVAQTGQCLPPSWPLTQPGERVVRQLGGR